MDKVFHVDRNVSLNVKMLEVFLREKRKVETVSMHRG
jgi:hypothetical protein